MIPAALVRLLAFLLHLNSGGGREFLSRLDPSLVAFLQRLRLTPWLYRQIKQQGLEGLLPAQILEVMRHDYARQLVASLKQGEEITRLLTVLGQAGVQVILIKGADLGLRLYRDPAVRPMADLDLLIAPQDLPRVDQVLKELGYRVLAPTLYLRAWIRPSRHYVPPPEGLLQVDIHWELPALAYFYRLPYPPLKQTALAADYQGLPVYILSPEHTLIYLCLHAYHHLPEFTQILDIPLFLISFSINWDLVLTELNRFQCQAPVYLMLREMAPVVPQAVPAAVLEHLAGYRPALLEKMVLEPRPRQLTFGFPAFFRHATPREWLSFVWANFWPPSEYLASNNLTRRDYLRSLTKQFL